MAGLEIISQEPIMTVSILGAILTILGTTLLLVIVPMLIDKLCRHFCIKQDNVLLVIIIVFIITIIPFCGFNLTAEPTRYSKYTANITEECRLTEFAEQYVIIHKNKDGTYLITDNLNYND